MTIYDENEFAKEQEQPEVVVEEEVSSNDEVEEVVVEEEQTKSKKSKKGDKKGSNKAKATVSELKKVTWPGFGKVVKETAVVLAVTAVFLVVIFGIDRLLYLLYNLLTSNM